MISGWLQRIVADLVSPHLWLAKSLSEQVIYVISETFDHFGIVRSQTAHLPTILTIQHRNKLSRKPILGSDDFHYGRMSPKGRILMKILIPVGFETEFDSDIVAREFSPLME